MVNNSEMLTMLTATATTELNQSNTYPYTFPKVMSSICLKNDGNTNITLTINGNSWTVKSGEPFNEFVGYFTVVNITNSGNSDFRMFARG